MLKLFLGVLFQNNLAICCKLWALKSKALLPEMQKIISLLFFSLFLLGRTSAQTFGSFTFNKLPQDFQLYPRESTNLADITVEGVAKSTEFTALSVRVLRNSTNNKYQKVALTFSGSSAKFSTKFQIPAELAEYDFEVYGFKGKDSSLVVKRKNVVAGDVYYVTGQSNAWIGPIDNLVYQGEWLRSFGAVQGNENFGPYNLADTLWSLPVGGARIGPWAAEMGRLLFESEKIPISIINSAAGGSNIDWLSILDGNISSPDGGNIMYYKALKSGTLNHVKGIIYRQGESEAAASIGTKYTWGVKFENLKQKYKKFFPSSQFLFVSQNNVYEYPYPEAAYVREDQRKQAYDPYVKVYATVGIKGFDRLHYSNDGYRQAAYEQFRIISKEIYKRNWPTEINSPKIQRAYFLSEKDRDKLFIDFEEGQNIVIPNDTMVVDLKNKTHKLSLADQFFWDEINTKSMSKNIKKIEVINGKKIAITFTLQYEGNIVSYIPSFHSNFVVGLTEYPYPGPYLKNKLGMRALGFSGFPIQMVDGESDVFTIGPNPATKQFTLRWPRLIQGSIKIYDMNGFVLYTDTIDVERERVVDVTNWPSANYFISYISREGRISTKRLVVIN